MGFLKMGALQMYGMCGGIMFFFPGLCRDDFAKCCGSCLDLDAP